MGVVGLLLMRVVVVEGQYDGGDEEEIKYAREVFGPLHRPPDRVYARVGCRVIEGRAGERRGRRAGRAESRVSEGEEQDDRDAQDGDENEGGRQKIESEAERRGERGGHDVGGEGGARAEASQSV